MACFLVYNSISAVFAENKHLFISRLTQKEETLNSTLVCKIIVSLVALSSDAFTTARVLKHFIQSIFTGVTRIEFAQFVFVSSMSSSQISHKSFKLVIEDDSNLSKNPDT